MQLLKESNLIFCESEWVQKFIIILPLTPGLLNAVKFSEYVPRSLQNSLLKNADILPTFKEHFSMLPKFLDPKCYTISETYFDVLQGSKVNWPGNFK